MHGSFGLTPEKRQKAEQLVADGRIDADEVLALGREIFADGVVSREEVDLLFFLDANARGDCAKWHNFFVDALTDYFVWNQYPPGVLTTESGQVLAGHVTADGQVNGQTEFRLLVNIIKHAKAAPDEVICLALETVKQAVLEGNGVLFGPDAQRPGVIDAADVAVIRDIIYGMAGEDGYTVSRREAELLFDLNDATRENRNADEWPDLFAKGVGNYLMFPRRQRTLSETGYRQQEDWLNDLGENRKAFISGMKDAVTSGGGLADSFRSVAAEFGITSSAEEAEALERAERERAHADALSRVDEQEADWLLDRIGRDGMLHENERALLRFVKETATSVPPSLSAYFEKVGV